MKPKMISVIADTFSPYNFEGTLEDLAKKVQDLIAVHGPNARLDYDKNYYYPYDRDPTPSFEIKVLREETPQELQKRLQEEDQYRRAQDQRDVQEFERLRAKFAQTSDKGSA